MASKPIVVYLTMKGGVGKTTLAANVTRSIADLRPKKILMVDADSQCNLTQLFVPPDEMDLVANRTIYHALKSAYGPSDLKTQIYSNPKNGSTIDLIRGSFETFALAVECTSLIDKKTLQRFSEFIRQAQDEYDLIVIDTNPSATLMTMHALSVSNFLVAPISFDKFSMRGVQLITSLLKTRYEWLTNPHRVKIVPNRIKRPITDRDREKLLDSEEKVRAEFPDLSRCIVPTYIRDSAIISGQDRKNRFVADQYVPNTNYLKALLEDFDNIATDLLATFDKAFGNESEKSKTVIGAMRDKYQSIFGGAVDRP